MDTNTQEIKKKIRRVQEKKQKKQETLDEAFGRILQMKLNDKERARVHEVWLALKDGEIDRAEPGKRLSKVEVLALHNVLEQKRRQDRINKLISDKPYNYVLITREAELQALIDDLKHESIAAWDTETTGLDWMVDKIIGVSVWLPKQEYGAYIPFGHTTGQRQLSERTVIGTLKEVLENPNHATVWHNAKYDLHMFRQHGVHVANVTWDTQVAAHVLNENEDHKLKLLARKYLNVHADLFDELIGDDDQVGVDKDYRWFGIYAIKDTELTWRLYEFQKKYIDNISGLRNIFYNVELPQIQVCVDMERVGFNVDVEQAKALEEEFKHEIKEAEKHVLESYGIDDAFLAKMSKAFDRSISTFSLSSPQHLQYLIYNHLGMEDISQYVNPKLSKKSTSSSVLEEMVKNDDRLEPLLVWREKQKLLTTYVQPLITGKIFSIDGKVHSNFSQFGTETGRYSSSQYGKKKDRKGINLQNIPAKGKNWDKSKEPAGKRVRKLFLPDDGYVIIGTDLSQIEPRVLADMSGDELLRKPYLDGWDLYMSLASQVFNKPYEECGDGTWERNAAKTALLAVMYGTSKWTLGRQLKISPNEAQKIIDDFYARYRDVKKWIDETYDFLLKNQYVETKFGRKRRFPEYRKWYDKMLQYRGVNWERLTKTEKEKVKEIYKYVNGMKRAAVNARIQGTAADILKMSMARMYELCKQRGWKMLATIHDEILLQVPINDVNERTIEQINEVMTTTVKLSVPIKADTVIMPRWGQEMTLVEFLGGAS